MASLPAPGLERLPALPVLCGLVASALCAALVGAGLAGAAARISPWIILVAAAAVVATAAVLADLSWAVVGLFLLLPVGLQNVGPLEVVQLASLAVLALVVAASATCRTWGVPLSVGVALGTVLLIGALSTAGSLTPELSVRALLQLGIGAGLMMSVAASIDSVDQLRRLVWVSAHWQRSGHALPAHGRSVAMLGRLISYKGIDISIRAIAEMEGSWTLVVIGPAEPQEGERLRRLASSLNVGDRVQFVPETPQAGRWLAAFDAVAVLTRQETGGFGREGYSLVALEALAAGVPLIGAAGNPEVDRMAVAAGIVVPPDDPAAVAGALRELDDAEHRRALGSRGREVVAGHPDAAATADRVSALLAERAGRPGAGLSGPPVTVLTCMRNEQGHVDGVMAAVTDQLREGDEYLVVDDGSTDSTGDEIARWASEDPRIKVLSGPEVNLAAARNHGFRAARNQVIACTDAGCVPDPSWLSALAAPFAEASPADLVVGVFTVPGGSPVQDAFSLSGFPDVAEARRRTPFVRAFSRVFGRAFSAERLDDRSMAVTVQAWQAVHGFDETLYSSEDAVFGHAVLTTGAHSVLTLDAEVSWEQPAHVAELVTKFSKYGEWAARAHNWRLMRPGLPSSGKLRRRVHSRPTRRTGGAHGAGRGRGGLPLVAGGEGCAGPRTSGDGRVDPRGAGVEGPGEGVAVYPGRDASCPPSSKFDRPGTVKENCSADR